MNETPCLTGQHRALNPGPEVNIRAMAPDPGWTEISLCLQIEIDLPLYWINTGVRNNGKL